MKIPAEFWAANGFKLPPYYNKNGVKYVFFAVYFFFDIELYR